MSEQSGDGRKKIPTDEGKRASSREVGGRKSRLMKENWRAVGRWAEEN